MKGSSTVEFPVSEGMVPGLETGYKLESTISEKKPLRLGGSWF